jgi:hypothetical protein
MSDKDRAQIAVDVDASVKGDGHRKRLAARYRISLDVMEWVVARIAVAS